MWDTRNDGAAVDRMGKRRVVGQPQILPEPHDHRPRHIRNSGAGFDFLRALGEKAGQPIRIHFRH